ncbi:hypothetical protein Rsub_06811 [Raphidocelis subcapitata]|uniref:Limiting CO2-inducible protein B/C beta carbonyic anhydrase domain-containing protein n=1 Tax=Raphidocelis subcapitata TaxID=307507 RepID=A0A2V0P1G3_9CHLO|nr:hypothetical protein Rsub_06811 [Raphidocelis subcapitata]|eukprot:GBF93708.1 hypothetical protein Rsub_06811 [Raphidocelis subcapitata]
MQLRASLGRAARPAAASARRAASAAPPRAAAASGNGAATSLADVDTYHQAWISAVDAADPAAAAPAAPAPAAPAPAASDGSETFVSSSRDAYFTRRHELVLRHFPNALGIDDFMSRVEIALSAHGFRGDNSIAMTNLCRDEITTVLKDKIESAFGGSFNTNGLGAALTCGVTGIKAGLSHSPLSVEDGRERYVFFSFPHTAIDGGGELGAISRPNRPGKSCACGALAKALNELQTEGLAPNCRVPGVHDPLDPEYSILKQRLARRIRWAFLGVLGGGKCVDIEKADYAVVTGVQIHNWSKDLEADNFEFVAPTKVYVVNRGQITVLDLMQLPSLTPRQIELLARDSGNKGAPSGISNSNQATPAEPERFVLQHLPIPTGPKPIPTAAEPIEALEVAPREGARRLGRPTMDGEEEERHTSFRVPPGVKVE